MIKNYLSQLKNCLCTIKRYLSAKQSEGFVTINLTNKMYTAIFIILCQIYSSVNSANILGAFVVPSISHQAVFQPIWRELSLRGHKVTVITPNPLKDPKLTNLTEIDVSFAYDILRKMNLQETMRKDLPLSRILETIYALTGDSAEAELAHPLVQELIRDKSKRFDVVLVEYLHPTMCALSVRFNCPLIGVTSLGSSLTGYDAVGNPTHPILYPDFLLPFVDDLGFFERLYSTYYSIYFRYFYEYKVIRKHDKIARKYISEDLPYLGDIERNVSLLLLNVNPVLHSPRPNVPAIIELGQMHIKEKKPLPKVS